MPISYNDAYDQTDPSLTDDQRKQSALDIVAGVAASDAYWNSRPEIERLQAQADGHGQVIRNTDGEKNSVSTQADAEATAVDTPGESAALPGPGNGTPPPATPDNPVEAVAKLRAQLQAAGINPEA